MNNSVFKSKILWKIYLVWFFRRILPLVVFEIVVLGAAVYLLAKYIFVEKVISNTFLFAGRNPLTMLSFLFDAFLRTSLLEQIAIIILLSIGALLLRDIGRTLASYRTTSRASEGMKPRTF